VPRGSAVRQEGHDRKAMVQIKSGKYHCALEQGNLPHASRAFEVCMSGSVMPLSFRRTYRQILLAITRDQWTDSKQTYTHTHIYLAPHFCKTIPLHGFKTS